MLVTPGNECSCCACTLAALFRDDGQSQQTTHDINIEFICFPSKFVSTEIRRIFFNFHQLWGWSRCTTRMKSVWCIRAATIFFFSFRNMKFVVQHWIHLWQQTCVAVRRPAPHCIQNASATMDDYSMQHSRNIWTNAERNSIQMELAS